MIEPEIQKLHAWLEAHEQELIEDDRAMLRIPSLESDAVPNGPFGQANRDALDLALKLSEQAGMKTVDLEGYLGYAEFGQGKHLILSLGHLDVVPTGPGWKYPEFGAEIHDGYIYARGAVDDKSPTMASFYAMRAVKECFPDLQVRFRQAFGCNEESGFGCVHRYVQTEEAPTFGVAPDSGWPVCYAEKGIADLLVTVPLRKGPISLVSLDGGQRPNIVIDHAVLKLDVDATVVGFVKEKAGAYWDKNVEFQWEGSRLTIVSHGKAAHGSTPFYGDSALTRVLRCATGIVPPEQAEFFRDLLGFTHPSGVGLGIHGREDATGDLTSNVGIVETKDGEVVFTVNVRLPTSWSEEELGRKAAEKTGSLEIGASAKVDHLSKGLFFPIDSPLVSAVISAYRAETGENNEPFTMGGGTYARAVPNTVSIGTGWIGDGEAHQTDERIKVDHILKMSKIYAHIFYKLALEAIKLG